MSDFIELSKSGNLVAMRDLVAHEQINVNFRHPCDGSTALYWSACNGHVAVCDWLLRHGATCNLPTIKTGSLPLHAAADRGRCDCVFLLLRSGSNVNSQTSTNGDTAMHLAAYRGHLDVCQVLVEHGACSYILNHQGRTALDEAHLMNHNYIVNYLHSTERNPDRLSADLSGRHSDGLIRLENKLSRKHPSDAVSPEKSIGQYPPNILWSNDEVRRTPSVTQYTARLQETRPDHQVTPHLAAKLECDRVQSNQDSDASFLVKSPGGPSKPRIPSESSETRERGCHHSTETANSSYRSTRDSSDVIEHLNKKIYELEGCTKTLEMELTCRDEELRRLAVENSTLRRRSATVEVLTRRLETQLGMVDSKFDGQMSHRRRDSTSHRWQS